MGICTSFPKISGTSKETKGGKKKGAASNAKRPSLGSSTGKTSEKGIKTPHRLSAVEIKERTDAPLKSEIIHYAGMKIKYGYVSQRGYYPDSPNKENQDSFLVVPSFEIQPKDEQPATAAFFGVFDGHGKDGHLCSRFVKKRVSIVIYYFSICFCIHLQKGN